METANWPADAKPSVMFDADPDRGGPKWQIAATVPCTATGGEAALAEAAKNETAKLA